MISGRRVIVHSCHAETEIRNKENFNSRRRYYSDDPKFESFKAIPIKCSCKKMVTEEQAKIYIEQGKAFKVYKPKDKRPLDDKRVDHYQIVMPVTKSQTPRVDLITKADIERAYVDGQEKYIRQIELIHEMIMEERAKLIVPFQEDPCDGRLLFPFGPDQRTYRGH